MDSIPRILHSSSSTRPPSAEAGDVGAAARGCHDAVAGAPGIVVIYLGTWKRQRQSLPTPAPHAAPEGGVLPRDRSCVWAGDWASLSKETPLGVREGSRTSWHLSGLA